jgi:hypothetical protein
MIVTPPTDTQQSKNIEQARHELREGIEASREIVRRSHMLIALAQSSRLPAANDNRG